MTRVHRGNRALWLGMVLVMLVGIAPIAAAGSVTPQPVLDSAPKELKFKGTAVIEGHLESASPGTEVQLQQRRDGSEWKTIATKVTDSNSEVRFTRDGLSKSSTFRLAYVDEAQSLESHSDTALVKVRPKLTLKVNPNDTYIGRTVTISGNLFPKVSGRRVIVQQKVSGEWRTIDRVPAGDSDYSTTMKARHKGFRRVRAIFRGDALNAAHTQRGPLRIYRKDLATWYGPGFYGNSTACGKTLTKGTLGVAHRTLPCGTKVSILYKGRTITVQVIDRGPYSGANWDLTQETAERLGFSGTDDIGVTR